MDIKINLETQAIKSILKVTPEDVIQEAEGIDTILKSIQWSVGDIVNKIYRHAIAAGAIITYDDAVRTTAMLIPTVRKFSTVKSYGLVARAFPVAVRLKYRHEDIPFAHFAYSLRFPEKLVTEPTRYIVLEYSIWEWLLTGGRKKTSVRNLKEVFEGVSPVSNSVNIHDNSSFPYQSTQNSQVIPVAQETDDPVLDLLMMLGEIEKILPNIMQADNFIGKVTATFISQIRQRFAINVEQEQSIEFP